MPPVSNQPKTLRPYVFHGVGLDWKEGEANATGDCPWCGREGKFSVEVADGLSKCWGCGGGDGTKGKNAVSFLKLLWERSLATTQVRDLAELAAERGLLDLDTLTQWGVCRSATTGDWLVPAFDVQGRLHQLHRYLLDRKTGRRLLLPTPDLWPEGRKLGLFGVPGSFAADGRKDGAYLCYSDDTEILTSNGWVLFQNLSDTDLVAAYDSASGCISFEKPKKRQTFRYKGEMVSIQADWCDLLITPDHRMFCKYQGTARGKIVLARDLKGQTQLPTCGVSQGLEEGSPTEIQARLLTAFIADGSISERGFQLTFNFYKDRKKIRLKNLLNEAGIPYKALHHPSSATNNHECIVIDHREDSARFFLEFQPDKTWTGKELEWNLEARKALLDEIRYWDGDNNGKTCFRYFTSKKNEAEVISAVAAVTGYSCVIRKQSRPERKNTNEEYVLNLTDRKWRAFVKPPSRKEYSGHVYCVTTSTGLVVVRRNGKTAVAGNCEGPWDGMALWETLGQAKHAGSNGDGKLALTGTSSSSLLATANVYAVPGCTSFSADWTPLFTGRRVAVLFDSDHPRNGTPPAGWAGTRRTVEALTGSSAGGPPSSVECLRWGEDGHDPTLKSGWDVRDVLKLLDTPAGRVEVLSGLLAMVVPVPDDWGMKREAIARSTPRELTSIPCTSWADLLNSWRKALRMRESLEDTLAVMLAVCASTIQSGDNQLFLQVIGDPGSAKTKLCDALLVSKHCFALEHLTGFHSGWKDPSGEDFSILSRCNGKTLITPEADVVMSNSNYGVIMSEQRRIFDGTSQAKFKNRKEEMKYTALRTPWIMAGTQKLLDKDQAQLGDRFMKIFIDHPGRDEQRAILRRVAFTAMQSVRRTATGDARSIVDANMMEAMCKTGGYVDWLRANIGEQLGGLETDEDAVADDCADYAELTAFLRARPTLDGHKRIDVHDAKELPTRLTGQYGRLASCLAVVYNRPSIDGNVMNRVRKLALDTAAGKTQQMVAQIVAEERARREMRLEPGIRLGTLAHRCTMSDDKTTGLLHFLRSVGAVESFSTKKTEATTGGVTMFRLTADLRDIWERVMGHGE